MKIKQTIKKIEEGCGMRESLGSPICQEDCLCDDCEKKLSGYKLALKDVLSEIKMLKIKQNQNVYDELSQEQESHNLALEKLKKLIQEVLK